MPVYQALGFTQRGGASTDIKPLVVGVFRRRVVVVVMGVSLGLKHAFVLLDCALVPQLFLFVVRVAF